MAKGTKKSKQDSFRDNVLEFFDRLVNQARAKALYDDYLMENILTWISAISRSTVRSLRHTATVIGMAIGASMVAVGKKNMDEIDDLQRQRAAESKKKKSNAKMVSELSENLETSNSMQDKLLKLLDQIFTG